jgi:phosphoesterase RecJ-like protein
MPFFFALSLPSCRIVKLGVSMKKKLNQTILALAETYKKEYRRILKAIQRYDHIVIYRHIMPDFDALGTQLGLYTWIKDNFKDKEVYFVGDNHVTFTPRLFPETCKLNDSFFAKPFLAIIVDVGNRSRIADPRFKKAKFKIRLDHHPEEEKLGNVSIVNPSMSAASELVVNMLLSFGDKYLMSDEAARYFYIALVGDSGRFLYSSTTSHTFAIAEELCSHRINISKIYQTMYVKKIEDLKVTAYILNHFSVSEHGIAYYVLPKTIQDELNITSERGKENVNIFSNIDGINAWCSFTEDVKDNCYRVSIRSKEKAINSVAQKFEGGGHAQASGAKVKNLEQIPLLIKALDELFI